MSYVEPPYIYSLRPIFMGGWGGVGRHIYIDQTPQPLLS